jgi:hypothetical protein
VDADVREGLNRTDGNQRLNKARVPALCIYRIDLRYRSGADDDRHRMEAGVARLQLCCLMLLVVVRRRPVMLVCRKAVMVLRMIVNCVLVDVQRRDLARGRGQDQSEQDSCEAMHRHECM